MKLKAKFSPRRDGSYGKVMDYRIDEHGVVDVTDEDHVDSILATGNFEPADTSDKDEGADGNEMLIQNGDQTIDLMAMDKAELMALANDEMGLALHPRTGEAKIRAAIVDYVKGE